MRALPLITIALVLACAGCASGRPMVARSQTPTVAAAANTAAPVATTPAAVPPGVPVSACHRRLSAWLRSGVKYEVNSLSNAINSFDQASNSNIYAAITFLDLAASAAHLASRWPIPACADPGGYWAATLSDVQQAAADAGTPASAQAGGGVPDAAVSDTQQMSSDFQSLTSELQQTTGTNPFG